MSKSKSKSKTEIKAKSKMKSSNKTETYFTQVPIEIVQKIAKIDSPWVPASATRNKQAAW